MSFTKEQIEEAGLKSLERAEKQKAYDKWYLAKARWELKELKKAVKEAGLTIPEFPDTKEDYA
ncbi:MAG: hypothetical protein Q8L27_02015 [archaeon]|nr:hypothetical protein [archaeon]